MQFDKLSGQLLYIHIMKNMKQYIVSYYLSVEQKDKFEERDRVLTSQVTHSLSWFQWSGGLVILSSSAGKD